MAYIDENIDLAIKLAKRSPHKTFKHGAVIAKGRKIKAIGFNQPLKHSWLVQRLRFGSDHAEISCLRQLTEDEAAGCTLYSIRVNKQGKLRMALPCKTCLSSLRIYGIKRIIYSNTEGQIITEPL